MAKGWNLIIDVAKCHGCYNCVLSTKDEYIGNEFPGYSAPEPAQGQHWIRIERKVRGSAPIVDAAYLPTTCNHCDEAPCVKAANGPAISKRADGIVLISPEHARGRRDLVDSCPYGAIWWNEELGLPQKWTFDAHLLDSGWKTTRGAQACPTDAMRAVFAEETELQAMVSEQGLEVLKPELQARPRVYYRNLHRFSGAFIAGKILAVVDGKTDCVAAARVALLQGERELAAVDTDDFGEFKFDGLKCGSGEYTIVASRRDAGSASCVAQLGESVCLGPMMLSLDSAASVA